MHNRKSITYIAYLIFLGSVFGNACPAHAQMTVKTFLATAENDYRLENRRELEDYLQNASGSTPYIDSIEFRTQTEEFEQKKQKYALRLYPKGWGETACNRQYAKVQKKALAIERSAYFDDALKQRYQLVLEYIRTTTTIQLKKELLGVYQDLIDVLQQKGANAIQVDLNALIAAQDQYTDLTLDLVELENEKTSILHQIRLAANNAFDVPEDFKFDISLVIDIHTIEQTLGRLPLDTMTINNIDLEDKKAKIEMAKIKYDLESAKNRDYLNLIEFAYDMDDQDEFDKAFSIKLGFKLPGINPDREQITNKKLKYLEAKLKYEERRRDTSEKISSLSRALQRLIAQYNILQKRKQNSNATISYKTYLKMEGSDPVALLKLKESMLNSDIQINHVNYRIRSKYLDLMDKLGKLSERPLKNYLSQNLEPIL